MRLYVVKKMARPVGLALSRITSVIAKSNSRLPDLQPRLTLLLLAICHEQHHPDQ